MSEVCAEHTSTRRDPQSVVQSLAVRLVGLDIVGPFLKAPRNKMYLLVGTDYFTKWVETEPLAKIKDVDAKKFIWKNTVTRFEVPHSLISNNSL